MNCFGKLQVFLEDSMIDVPGPGPKFQGRRILLPFFLNGGTTDHHCPLYIKYLDILCMHTSQLQQKIVTFSNFSLSTAKIKRLEIHFFRFSYKVIYLSFVFGLIWNCVKLSAKVKGGIKL